MNHMKMLLNSTVEAVAKKLTLENETDSKATLLRICKKSALSPLDELNFTQFHSENYLSARTLLTWLAEKNSSFPDIIIIDLPFVKREVENFSEWLNKSPELSKIPIVYSSRFVGTAELKELYLACPVDDIIDLGKNAHLLHRKAKFLKKLKRARFETSQGMDMKEISQSSEIMFKEFFRRLLDILISLSLVTLLLPLFLLIALVVKLESKGPVFYISKRAGKGYKIFDFYKFRTMHIGADSQREELEKLNLYSIKNSSARFFKIKNDPRITKVGAFLRNTSLDELPQLLNVLKGDMSIVGNRPLPLYEAATLTTDEWAERFMAPAGITGLWQIKKRGKDKMSVEERINLDIAYAKNNNIFKDLWIIIRTPAALFQKTNV